MYAYIHAYILRVGSCFFSPYGLFCVLLNAYAGVYTATAAGSHGSDSP